MKNRWHRTKMAGVAAGLFLATGLIFMRKVRWPAVGVLLATAHGVAAQQPAGSQGPTVVHVTPTVIHDHVKRMGMNLGGQGYYDSQQILNNLLSRNPGFEGQEQQSVLRCAKVTSTSCTDESAASGWPEGFLDGATYEFIAGAAKGQKGKIIHSTAVDKTAKTGVTIQFAQGANTPAVNDYVVVRSSTSGGAGVGWWVQVSGGGTVTTELKDLSPHTPGKQAARLSSLGDKMNATLASFFANGFIRMQGPYVLKFRAKGTGGNNTLFISLRRIGQPVIYQQNVVLTSEWKDYSYPIQMNEGLGQTGPMAISLATYKGEVLLDDVSLAAVSTNGTAFRDEVVAALERMHPGVLRYMDSGKNFGSSLDNMLAVAEARKRTGYNKCCAVPEEIPVGLHDFLVLSEKLGAEPWYAMQIGMTEQEGKDLLEYLGGPVSSKYGAKRAALGHPVPWTKVFPTIHLEYGNEAWNTAFQGGSLGDPRAYGDRTATIFRAIRSSPYYSQSEYNLIANGFAISPQHNGKVLDAGDGIDTIDIAPYLFATFVDDSSVEAVFGPMLAEPEWMDKAAISINAAHALVAAKARRPAHVAVYETNMGTTQGTVPQSSLDAAVPSMGAGLATIDHMLLMLRDDGIIVQNTFQLTGHHAGFLNRKTYQRDETSPVWGVVVDLGGQTNRVRPSFLSQELANQVILPTMLQTTISGDDPTWDQPLSANDKVEIKGAHDLQTFAFTDGKKNTLILLNLSRTSAHPVRLEGANAPRGAVTVKTLTSNRISDTNELAENVKIATRQEDDVTPGKTVFTLPPFSMTVLLPDGQGRGTTRPHASN